MTITEGDRTSKPDDPTREGWTFDGFFKDKNFSERFDFNSKINKNTTIYLKWTRITYKVTFDSNGGSAVDSQTIGQGEGVKQPTQPTKSGYTFTGWYKDEALEFKFDFAAEKITKEITLYAKYEVLIVVTFNKANATITGLKTEYQNTDNLTMVIPDTIDGVQVKNIANKAFQNRQKLVEVIILAKAITNIGTEAFNATKIKTINLPNSIVTIGLSCFRDADVLKNIQLPNQLKIISASLLGNCRGLTNVIIPDTVTKIESTAFERCNSLKNISVPASVTSIGREAFYFSTKLTVKMLGATPPTLDMFRSGAFGELTVGVIAHVKSIEVPSAALATYKAATGWKEYTDGGSKPNLLTGY